MLLNSNNNRKNAKGHFIPSIIPSFPSIKALPQKSLPFHQKDATTHSGCRWQIVGFKACFIGTNHVKLLFRHCKAMHKATA